MLGKVDARNGDGYTMVYLQVDRSINQSITLRMFIKALHMTYDALSMVECSNSFNRNIVTAVPVVPLVIEPVLSKRLITFSRVDYTAPCLQYTRSNPL